MFPRRLAGTNLSSWTRSNAFHAADRPCQRYLFQTKPAAWACESRHFMAGIAIPSSGHRVARSTRKSSANQKQMREQRCKYAGQKRQREGSSTGSSARKVRKPRSIKGSIADPVGHQPCAAHVAFLPIVTINTCIQYPFCFCSSNYHLYRVSSNGTLTARVSHGVATR